MGREALEEHGVGVDALFVNEGKDQALRVHLPDAPRPPLKITTFGASGAIISKQGDPEIVIPACKAEPVDTTGAGDTFTGTFLASPDAGLNLERAWRIASAAPSRAEIEAFFSETP